jgi:hypothetical protein
VIAHMGGVPLEEALPTLAGSGTALLGVRAWLMLHLRRRREPRDVTDDQTAAHRAQGLTAACPQV